MGATSCSWPIPHWETGPHVLPGVAEKVDPKTQDLQVRSEVSVGAAFCSWPAGQTVHGEQGLLFPVEKNPLVQDLQVRSVEVVPATSCSVPGPQTDQLIQVVPLPVEYLPAVQFRQVRSVDAVPTVFCS